MIILQIFIGLFAAVGIGCILADLMKVPTMKASKAANNLGKKGDKKTSIIEIYLKEFATKLSEKIKLNEYKKAQLEADLRTAGMDITPELYVSNVSGVHNYYRYATHISKDIRKIAFGITRTMKNRLRNRLQVQGDTLPKYIAERYGKSKQLRYINGQAVIPIGYVQTKAPLYKKREINKYTPKGRLLIHKELECVNIGILHCLMRNPVQHTSVEFNNNRLALYCAQHGCCAVTKEPLVIGEIHCHHKVPRKQGGTDEYNNLVLVSDKIHILIHATDEKIISAYTEMLHLDAKQKAKLNKLRRSANLFTI